MSRDVRLIRSPLSVIGMMLTTVSAVTFLVVFLADLFGLHTNPYIGILFFLMLSSAQGGGAGRLRHLSIRPPHGASSAS